MFRKIFKAGLLLAVGAVSFFLAVDAIPSQRLTESGMTSKLIVVTLMNPAGTVTSEYHTDADRFLRFQGQRHRSFGERCAIAPRARFEPVGEDSGRVLVQLTEEVHIDFKERPLVALGNPAYVCGYGTLFWMTRAEYLAAVRWLATDKAAEQKAVDDRDRERATVWRLIQEHEYAQRLPAEAPAPATPKPAAKPVRR